MHIISCGTQEFFSFILVVIVPVSFHIFRLHLSTLFVPFAIFLLYCLHLSVAYICQTISLLLAFLFYHLHFVICVNFLICIFLELHHLHNQFQLHSASNSVFFIIILFYNAFFSLYHLNYHQFFCFVLFFCHLRNLCPVRLPYLSPLDHYQFMPSLCSSIHIILFIQFFESVI